MDKAALEVAVDLYLIRKSGAWYRPNSAGYTNNIAEAGRYTLAEAEKITHPNGPNGPRDNMSYEPAPANTAALPSPGEAKPVAWEGVADGIRYGLTANPKIAQLWRETGRVVTPLYAAPPSERKVIENDFAEYEGVTAKELAETAARYGKALKKIADGPWPSGVDTPEEQAVWDAGVARAALRASGGTP